MRGDDDRAMHVGMDHIIMRRLHAEHIHRLAEIDDMDVRMAGADPAADDLEVLGGCGKIAEGAVGHAAERAEPAVQIGVHLAPERAIAGPVIQILNDDDGRQRRVRDIFIPGDALGDLAARRLFGPHGSDTRQTDDRRRGRMERNHGLHGEADGAALGHDQLQRVADGRRVPLGQKPARSAAVNG